jgi:hypothetical protein
LEVRYGDVRRTPLPRTPVHKSKKKDRSVKAPILPPPVRCAPFLEGAPLPVDVLCKEGYHTEISLIS